MSGEPDPLFALSGEVARAMAEVDWAATPLGASHTWTRELRGVVRVLLGSRFSMWMAWGPELTMFYNDAYRRDTLRDKHPWALGRPASEVWAEIWNEVTPQVRVVLDEGRSTWDEDLRLYVERSGWSEESYHTFSYSPLADEDGRVLGLLCVVTETTGRVLAQRRMAFLRDLAAGTSNARTTDTVIRCAREVLARNPLDLPMSLLYLVDPHTPDRARLAAAAGVEPGSPAAPSEIVLAGPGPSWPLGRVTTGTVELPPVDTLASGLPPGCDRVALVALGAPGSDGGERLGVLVAGLSRHLAFDEPYRDFVGLVAGQITSGVLDARAAESERERAESLAELDRARRRFFADASHELRTPLTLIAAPVDGLLGEPQVDPTRWRSELEVVARNTRRLSRLIDDLLEVSRLNDGAVGPRRVPVDLGPLTFEVADTVAPAMARAGLQYEVDVPPAGSPDAVSATVDPRGWERIVLNLVANALKYTRVGRVTVRVRRQGDDAVLTVGDTGIGIPAAELPLLFDRFHRVEGAWARSSEGNGVGLALVSELVAAHGGEVTVASEPDVGSTFTVTVPAGPAGYEHGSAIVLGERSRALADEASRWVPEVEPEPEPRTAGGADDVVGRVLVVDDNADMRAYVSRLLAPRAEVTTAADGDAGLAAALAEPPDMIVSDVMMPGRTGLELLTALRADPRTARVPVLLLSARAGEEAAVEGLAAQADDYMVKPFAPGELQARVLSHLQLGRARREAEARFVAVADLAPAMIWVADDDGSRVFLNAGWTRFTGRDRDTDLGHGWLEGIHPDDRAGYDALVAQARAAGQGWEADLRLRHADGTYHQVVEQAIAVPGSAGRAEAGGWVGSCIDVQSRMRQVDRVRLLAELGVAMGAVDTVEGRLAALRRVLAEARLGDHVALLDPRARPGTQHPACETPGETGAGETGAGETGAGGVRHRLRRPLTVGGRVERVLVLERGPGSPPWSEHDAELIDDVVARTLPALDNALLRAEERRAADRLVLVQRATASFSGAVTPEEVAQEMVSHVGELLGPDAESAVFEFDAAARELRVLARRPADTRTVPLGAVVGLDEDLLSSRAVRHERAIWVHEPDPDGPPDAQDPALLALARVRGFAMAAALPLIAAGRIVGAFSVGVPDRGVLDPGERTTLQALAEPGAVAFDRARLYRAEHEIAQTLQRSLLPQRLPEVARLPVAVRYLPGAVGTSAGGDWYDLVEVDERRVAVVVGDVVGQGAAAAAVMGQLRTALSGYLLAGHGPAAALDLLDRLVTRVPGARASTAICLVVDVGTGEVCWARAGHLPALVLDGGEPRLLTDAAGHGPLLGLGAARRGDRTEGELTISPGTSLVLYTDGLVERRGESLDEGLDRLVEVAGAVPQRPPEVLATALVDRLAPAEAVDDVAVVVVRLTPGPLERRLPADPVQLAVLRRDVREWSARTGLAEDVVEDLQLALGEAVTNAVEHAYGPAPAADARVSVDLDARPEGGITVEVRDAGRWSPADPDPGHRGRGLALIRALAHDVVVDGGPDGTHVTFTVPTERPESRRPQHTPEGVPAVRPAHVEIVDSPGGPRVVVEGDLDLAGAGLVWRRLAEPGIPSAGPWTLDLRGVGHLASAGIGLLIEARERGADLALPTTGPAARVLALCGLAPPPPQDGAPPAGQPVTSETP